MQMSICQQRPLNFPLLFQVGWKLGAVVKGSQPSEADDGSLFVGFLLIDAQAFSDPYPPHMN
jgi:hypothetical protein